MNAAPLTLAAVKRRLTPGVRVTLVWHRYASTWGGVAATSDTVKAGERQALIDGRGLTRAVAHAQGNGIQFDGGSWLYWPKAAEFRALDGDTFEILDDLYERGVIAPTTGPVMRYRIEPTTGDENR